MRFSSQAVPKSRPAHRVTLALLVVWAMSATALAASAFPPQMRLGYRTGDQWEPAIAADSRGHIYVLYPQYGAVPGCSSCKAPTMTLLVSEDNGLSWQPSRPILPLATGQFDAQITVDPVDHQTVYASWLQNNKRDIVVARSPDFGRTWSFSWAERGREDADKPTLAVRGADVYVGFNHEEKLFVASSHDGGQTFSRLAVNPNAERGSSLAGGATVDPAGNIYFGWTAYARHDMEKSSVNIYVSRSADGGRSWTTALLDRSSAPPGCEGEGCQTGSGPADCVGVGFGGRALCVVECGRGERRSRAHLLFIINHCGSDMVGAGGCLQRGHRGRTRVSHAGGRGFRRHPNRVDGHSENVDDSSTCHSLEHVLPRVDQRWSDLGRGNPAVERRAGL